MTSKDEIQSFANGYAQARIHDPLVHYYVAYAAIRDLVNAPASQKAAAKKHLPALLADLSEAAFQTVYADFTREVDSYNPAVIKAHGTANIEQSILERLEKICNEHYEKWQKINLKKG